MIQVAYTNSNCADLWDAFTKQNSKFSNLPIYLISDKTPNWLGSSNVFLSGFHTYKNEEPYYKAWVDALNFFRHEYFIYLQEDFFLYSKVDEQKIKDYQIFLDEHPEYSFVRLIKSGNLNGKQITDTLFEIESNNEHVFAMQATIWRTYDYIKLMEYVKDEKWLENDKYRKAMIDLNIKGVYHYDNEPKRGLNHYDSKVYPYIATALVRGKWNLSEYPKELGDILKEHKIDTKIRGIY